MVDRTYRRTVLRAVGAGLVAGLAGCSNSGNDGETDERDGGADGSRDSDGSSVAETGTPSESESPTTQTETQDGGQEEYDDSEESSFEESIEQQLDDGGREEVHTGWIEEYEWIEIDDVEEQLKMGESELTDEQIEKQYDNEELQGFMYDVRQWLFGRQGPEHEFFTNGYIALAEDFDPEKPEMNRNKPDTQYIFQVVSLYEADGETASRWSLPRGGGVFVEDAENLETFFDEVVSGYSDRSDEMPQEYLELAES